MAKPREAAHEGAHPPAAVRGLTDDHPLTPSTAVSSQARVSRTGWCTDFCRRRPSPVAEAHVRQ